MEYVSCPACGDKADKIIMRSDGVFNYYKVVCYECGHITEMAYRSNLSIPKNQKINMVYHHIVCPHCNKETSFNGVKVEDRNNNLIFTIKCLSCGELSEIKGVDYNSPVRIIDKEQAHD